MLTCFASSLDDLKKLMRGYGLMQQSIHKHQQPIKKVNTQVVSLQVGQGQFNSCFNKILSFISQVEVHSCCLQLDFMGLPVYEAVKKPYHAVEC